MVSELKSVTGIAVVVEGVSSNGVQSTFKFAVNPQTQGRDQLERASRAVPTLLDLIGVTMVAPTPATTRTEDLDGLDDLPSGKARPRSQPQAEREDDDE